MNVSLCNGPYAQEKLNRVATGTKHFPVCLCHERLCVCVREREAEKERVKLRESLYHIERCRQHSPCSTKDTGFPGGSVVKIYLPVQETRVRSWVGKIPWRRKWQPTAIFQSGKSHGQRSLADCSPWGSQRLGHNLATKQQNNKQLGHKKKVRRP